MPAGVDRVGQFKQLLTLIGDKTSKPEYYAHGKAGDKEWRNLITVAFERTKPGSAQRAALVKHLGTMGFWQGANSLAYWNKFDGNPGDLATLTQAAAVRFPKMTVTPAGGGVTTAPGAPAEEKKDKAGVGGGGEDPETQLKILTGKEMKWFFDRTSGKWYVQYGLPGSAKSMIFEARPEQMDALFGKGKRPTNYTNSTLKNLTNMTGVTFGGNVSEMEGTGSFESEVQRVQTLALDNGVLPEWAKKDGAAMDIIYIAQSEGKSDEWVLDQLSQTTGFQQRFQGIQAFRKTQNLSLAEAVTGYLEFEAGVKHAVNQYNGNVAGVTPTMIGGLLNQGHTLTTINDVVTGFDRLKEHKPALDAFNAVLQAKGFAPLANLQQMLDFMKGRAPSEYYDLYEASSLREAAVGAGLGDLVSVTDSIKRARAGNYTIESASEAMKTAAEMILRLRHEVDVSKYGLDHEELIDISLGQAPRSGRPESEVRESINRAVAAAQKSLTMRATTFKRFDDEGRPQAASVSNLRQGY